MAANNHKLTWVNPTKNTDGTNYDAAAQNDGYELAINGTVPTLVLPFKLGTEFTLNSQVAAYDALPSGTHQVRLRVVNKDGIYSDWTAPASFRKVGTPLAPSAFTVV